MRGLSSVYGKYITGPAQPVVDRIRNQYLWELLCKIPKQQTSITTFKNRLQQQIFILQTNKRYRSVSIVINVDPL
jgi:primosomal protein N' (replication factor Y)